MRFLLVAIGVMFVASSPAAWAERLLVCKDGGAGGYEAFPDICRLGDGRLMCAFYAGYDHVSQPNAQWPEGGRLVYCVSQDEGATWSEPRVLYDGPNDERDPSLTQLPSGRLLCTFFCAYEANTYLIHSDDAGATWSAPELIAPGYYVSSPIRLLLGGATAAGGEKTDSGCERPRSTASEPLLPREDGPTDGDCGGVTRMVLGVYRQHEEAAHGAVVISDDGGKTWAKATDIDNAGCRLDAETDVIELKDGTLYALQRNSGYQPMMISISKDRGCTWSVSKPVGFPGHAPYLHRTDNDHIVLGYRNLVDRNTSIRHSNDECRTWSDPVAMDPGMGAYPSFVNLRDGSVLVVYYPGSNICARRFAVNQHGVRWLKPYGQEELSERVGKAWNPRPADRAERVGTTCSLSWSPGDYARTHHVYFGLAPDKLARVASKESGDCTYRPKELAPGKTYYWRIDEINEAHPHSPWVGDVWSFKVGQYADYLGAGHWDDASAKGTMRATAAASLCPSKPKYTVDGSGLTDRSAHGTSWQKTMWLSPKAVSNRNPGTEPGWTWIKYDFGQVYKLKSMAVWNYNQEGSSVHRGLRNVTIEYSTTGGHAASNWTKLGEYEFAMAPEPGSPDYQPNTRIEFGGATARYVVITAHMTNGTWSSSRYGGLAEVRFDLAKAAAAE